MLRLFLLVPTTTRQR